ncbi:MAG TPA: universal stress protein [Bryobacteraceae bacterium]|nr:universal stress protein [Bryobacteraceae bacterium]
MKILITTDGSKEAADAARAASRLLTVNDRHVDVLYVAPELRAPKSGKVSRQEYQHRAAVETRRILEEAKQILAEEGVDAVTLCATGSPAKVIMRDGVDYDIVVIGAKGREVRAEVGIGPVASRVVEHATGCVLVGREPPSDQGMRILVPIDGSAGSEHALDALSSFFDIESAEITLLHVLETLWLPTDADDADSGQTDQLVLEFKREAEQLLAEARGRFLAAHSDVTTSVREGIPANEILSEIDQGAYDLVVVGASDAADLKHSVLGSVSVKVAWNAPCSVLVVRVPE